MSKLSWCWATCDSRKRPEGRTIVPRQRGKVRKIKMKVHIFRAQKKKRKKPEEQSKDDVLLSIRRTGLQGGQFMPRPITSQIYGTLPVWVHRNGTQRLANERIASKSFFLFILFIFIILLSDLFSLFSVFLLILRQPIDWPSFSLLARDPQLHQVTRGLC